VEILVQGSELAELARARRHSKNLSGDVRCIMKEGLNTVLAEARRARYHAGKPHWAQTTWDHQAGNGRIVSKCVCGQIWYNDFSLRCVVYVEEPDEVK